MTQALLKALGIWLLLSLLAVLNGALREKALVLMFGPKLALPLSGLTLSSLILLTSWFLVPWLGPLCSGHYWIIGGQWLVMTLLFEFSFGHFLAGKSWGQLLEAYDVTTGNLCVLVLLVTLASPYLAAKLRCLI